MSSSVSLRRLKVLLNSALDLVRAATPRPSQTQSFDRDFVTRNVTVEGCEYPYRVYVPPNASKTTALPILLFLHGAGGYGNDGIGQITEGLAPAIMRHPERFPALAVFPQIARDGGSGWQGKGGRIAMAALDAAIAEFNGDESRIVLTGLSMGGNGAWYLAYHHVHRFAGLLVICGFVDERQGTVYPIFYPSLAPGDVNASAAVATRLAHMPIWIFHGDADLSVPVDHSRRLAAALLAQAAQAVYTELAGVGHNAWDHVYDRPDVARWLLGQRLTAPMA